MTEAAAPTIPAARCNAGTARFAHNDATPLWTEAEVRAAVDAATETLRAEARELREMLRNTQTAVCAGSRDLLLFDMPGKIAELLHRTRHLKR